MLIIATVICVYVICLQIIVLFSQHHAIAITILQFCFVLYGAREEEYNVSSAFFHGISENDIIKYTVGLLFSVEYPITGLFRY